MSLEGTPSQAPAVELGQEGAADVAAFAASFEHAAVGMAHLTPDGIFLRVNSRLCAMTGYRAEELVGMSFRQVTLPDDFSERDQLRLDRLAALGGAYSAERRYRRKDGEVIWIRLITTMIRDTAGAPPFGLSVIEDITEHKRAQDEARRTLQQLKRQTSLLDDASHVAGVGSWDLDVRTGKLCWSDEALLICGLRPDDAPDTVEAFLSLVHPDDRATVRACRGGATGKPGSNLQLEYRIRRADGEERVVVDRGAVVEHEAGRGVRLAGVVMDVTERRAAENRQRRNVELLAALVEIQRRLAAAEPTLEELVAEIPALALQVVEAEGAAFAALEGDELVGRAASPVLDRLIDMRLPVAQSLSGEAVRQNRTIFCADTAADARASLAAVARFGLRSVLVSVLREAGRPIGVITVVAKRPGQFRSADADMLELLAEALGSALQRRRFAEGLRETARTQQGIVRIQQQIASATSLQESIGTVARGVGELTQGAGVAVLVREADTLVCRAAIGCVSPHAGREWPGGTAIAEIETLLRSSLGGTEAGTSVLSAPIRCEPWPPGALIVVGGGASEARDRSTVLLLAESISASLARDRAAWEVLRSEREYRLLFAANPLPMWVYDATSLRFLAVNDAALARYGYERAEFLGMSILDIRSREEAARLLGTLHSAASGRRDSAGWLHRAKDGTEFEVEISSNPIRFGAGSARLALVQDVSARVRAERETAKSQMLLSIAAKVARVAGWSYDMRTAVFSYSPELCAIHELERGTTVSLREALEFYAPESRETMLQAAEACARQGTPYDLELALVTAAGRRLEVRSIGEPVRDAQGVIVGMQGALQDITETIAARKLQEASSHRFHTALNRITQGVCFFDADERLIVCNARYAEIYGLEPRSLLPGITLAEIIEHRVAVGMAPAMGRSEFLAWRRSLARTRDSDTVSVLEDGRTIAIHHVAMPEGGWVATHEDITDRLAAQEELRALNDSLEQKVAARTHELAEMNRALISKEEEIRSVLEHMADCVVTFNDAGQIRSANSKVFQVFGRRPDELVGRSVESIVPDLLTRYLAHGEAPRDLVLAQVTGRHENGDGIALEVALSLVHLKDERLTTAILRDIGERIAIIADLERARHDAEQASRAKSEFVATMSHEIRTPMNGVVGTLEVMAATELSTEQRRLLGLARDSATSLMGLIEGILDFSKIEAGKMEFELRPFSVAHALREVCGSFEAMAARQGVALSLAVDEALPAAVLGDSLRFRQVLNNIVNNAVKFSNSPDARGSVEVGAKLVSGAAGRVEIEVCVADNGIGMTRGVCASLFRAFSQADASTTRRFGGTGLGLAISKHLVDLMGGEILVSSTPGAGSQFTVRLPFESTTEPVDAAEAARCRDLEPQPLAAPAPRHEGAILLVEDNAINQHVILAQLRLLGFDATLAANGREALAAWRTAAFDLVLTDLQMPEMDGYALAAAIRTAEGAGTRVPIVALTANALKGEAERCLAAGMDGYLTKPLRVAALDEVLAKWLGQPRTAAAPGSPASSIERNEPVDAAVLPALLGQDVRQVDSLFRQFGASLTRETMRLKKAALIVDAATVARLAHSLKSAARTVGAHRLADLCAELEATADGAGPGSFVDACAAIASEAERVLAWIEQRCGQRAHRGEMR